MQKQREIDESTKQTKIQNQPKKLQLCTEKFDMKTTMKKPKNEKLQHCDIFTEEIGERLDLVDAFVYALVKAGDT